jgi:uncharacterized paraquat-inducible protein A
MEGEISKSMGIDTKPAHKFEINGFWLMLDPNADEATVEQVQGLITENERVKEAVKNCSNCKHKEVHATHEPCASCSILAYNKCFADLKSNWEAEQ